MVLLKFLKYVVALLAPTLVVPFHVVVGFAADPYLAVDVLRSVAVHPANVCTLLAEVTALPPLVILAP